MRAVCADVGLSKNNKIKLISQNGYHKVRRWQIFLYLAVTMWSWRWAFYEIIYLQKVGCVLNLLQLCNSSLRFFFPKDR